MSKLDEVIKNINSKFKMDIITKDIDAITFNGIETVPFNSPAHTFLFRGGFKTGSLWQFVGPESSSKTTTAMAIAGCFQKYYKKKWEDRVAYLESLEKPSKNEKQELVKLLDDGYKKVAFIDVERAADSVWASKMGFDMNDCWYVKIEDQTAEEICDIIDALVTSDGICLVIIDSVAAMISEAQRSKSYTEKTYCGIASVITNFTNKIKPLLHKHDCSIIAINQLRDTLSAQFPDTHSPGGHALKHNSDCILSFRKAKPIDENFKEIANKSDYYFGQYYEISVKKNKITKPDRRLTRQAIVFDKGLYPLLDTVNIAIDYGIITKSGAWFTFEDEQGNPCIDSEENNMKWQGLTGVVKYFEIHEKEYSELFDLVDKKVRENS